MNKVILIGFTGKDPEVKMFENGVKIASFSLAVTEKGYRTSTGIEVPERTDWFNIITRNSAEFVEKWIKKGSGVLVEGKLHNRQYEDKNGKHYVTEIMADKVEFFSFGKKKEEKEA